MPCDVVRGAKTTRLQRSEVYWYEHSLGLQLITPGGHPRQLTIDPGRLKVAMLRTEAPEPVSLWFAMEAASTSSVMFPRLVKR